MKKITVEDTITIIGGSGFIGKNIVRELATTGARIKIVSRNPDKNSEVMTSGYVGQIAHLKCDAKDTVALNNAIKGSTYVINLVGILYPSGKQKFNTLHSNVAKNIALACKENNVESLIHFSALGVDKAVTSEYAKTKLEGEKAVLDNFPKAIILRPSVIFGADDNFINLFNWLSKFSPVLPLIGGGHSKFQPIYVRDVAALIYKILTVDKNLVEGKIFELGGPSVYSMKEIYKIILHTTQRKRLMINMPFWFMKLNAFFLELLPKPLLTRDQVELLKYDNLVSQKNALETFDIKPTSLEAIVPFYLR